MNKIVLMSIVVDAVISFSLVFYNTDNTQIDWTAFVSQGDGVLDGIYDYSKLCGPGGMMAYGAIDAYIYALLSYLQISYSYLKSQLLWATLHLVMAGFRAAIVDIAIQNKMRKYFCLCLCLLQFHERHWSLIMLQNDFLLQLFMVISVYLLLKNQCIFSMLFFNLAVSIKFGAIVWLLGYILILSQKRSILSVIFFFAFSVAFQILTAWPFLQTNAEAYIEKFIGVGRTLRPRFHTYFAFYPVKPFYYQYKKELMLVSVSLILTFNVIFLLFIWTNWRKLFREVRLWPISLKLESVDPYTAVKIIYTSVLLVVIFSNQQHPQFILWYAPIYPFLITICDFPLSFKLLMSFVLEYTTVTKYRPYMSHVGLLFQFILFFNLLLNRVLSGEKLTMGNVKELKKEAVEKKVEGKEKFD